MVQKKPGLNVADSKDEAEYEAGVDPGHVDVDFQVRINRRQ